MLDLEELKILRRFEIEMDSLGYNIIKEKVTKVKNGIKSKPIIQYKLFKPSEEGIIYIGTIKQKTILESGLYG